MSDDVEAEGRRLLGVLTGRADADFRDGQWEAIEALVVERRRVLVVQRTGWGKSAVYFIATRLLRDQGAGPTLLVSPLLALMRNQIEAARAHGRAGARRSTATTTTSGTRSRPQLDGGRRSTCCSSRPSGSPTPRSATRCCPTVGAAAGLLVDRRGALHQRLGPRLPARLPAHRAASSTSLPAGVPVLCTHRHRQRPRRRRHRSPARRRPRWSSAARSTARASRLHVSTCRSQAERLAWLARDASRAARHRASSTASPIADAAPGRRVAARQRHRRRPPTPATTDDETAARVEQRPAGQRAQGRRRHLGARHGLRQARPRVRHPLPVARARRSPTTSRSAGPAAALDRVAAASSSAAHEDADIQDWFIRTRLPAAASRPTEVRRRCSSDDGGCVPLDQIEARGEPAAAAGSSCC